MDDEFKKYSFITPNSDKPIPKKCNPMDNGKYSIITRNLDNLERDRMIPDNKEVLEQEVALQQVKTTLSNVSKQLDQVMKHSSHKGAAGGLPPSWGYGSELGGGGAAGGGGLPPSWGYGSELGGGGAAGGGGPPQNYADHYVWAQPLSPEAERGAESRRKSMAACKKHDRPDQGQKGGSGIIDMFTPVRGRSRSSKRKSSSSRRPRRRNARKTKRKTARRGRGRGRSSRRVRR